MAPGLQLGLGVRNFENMIRTESDEVGVGKAFLSGLK